MDKQIDNQMSMILWKRHSYGGLDSRLLHKKIGGTGQGKELRRTHWTEQITVTRQRGLSDGKSQEGRRALRVALPTPSFVTSVS